MSKRGRKAGRIKGMSESRIAAFEAALWGRPWSSAADLARIFLIDVCAVRTLLERMAAAGLAARIVRPSGKAAPPTRLYALPGAPEPEATVEKDPPPAPREARKDAREEKRAALAPFPLLSPEEARGAFSGSAPR